MRYSLSRQQDTKIRELSIDILHQKFEIYRRHWTNLIDQDGDLIFWIKKHQKLLFTKNIKNKFSTKNFKGGRKGYTIWFASANF